MPVLPGPEDLGGEPSARSGRAVARVDTTAVGEGVARLGQGIQQVGQVLQRNALIEARQKKIESDRDQAFATQSQFLQFEQAQHDRYSEETQKAQPGAPAFSDQFVSSYDQEAQKFYENAPPGLKPQYKNKLLELRGRLRDTTTAFQTEEKSRFAKEQIATGQETVLNRLSNDPAAWASADQDAETQIRTSPLTPVEQDKAIRDWRQRRAEALWTIDNTSDPNAARERLGIGSKAGSYADKVVGVESGGDASAQNPNSTATGAGQFIESTWAQFVRERHPELAAQGEDIQKFRNDRALSHEAVQWYAEKNASALQSAGAPVTDGTLYLAHFAGPQGAVALLKADPNASAESVLGSKVVNANPFLKGKSAADVIAWADKKMGGTSSPAPQYADMPFEERQKLYDASQKDQIQETNNQVADTVAFLRSGQGVKSGDPEGVSKFTLPELERVYSSDDAAKVRDEIDKAAAYGKDVAATEFAAPNEINTILKSREELLSKPEEFRQHAQDMNGLLNVIKERNTALVNDPANYVQKDPEVDAAYQAMTKAPDSPALVSNYADATLAKQAQLGLPPEARAILPKAAQQEIVSQFTNQPEGGQSAAHLMQGLEQQWGKYWPQVFGELSKDLPGPAVVVGSMNRPGQERAAEQLAQAAVLGTKALADVLPNDSVKTISDGLPGVMGGFASTLSHSGIIGRRTYGTFFEGVKTLALSYAGQGEDPAVALTRAYEDVLGKAYTMAGTYRIPIEHNADAIQTGAEHILQNISGENWALPISLAGLNDEETRAAYLDTVKANGFWVTSPDESGLTLWDGQQAILTTDGKPVQATWQEILDLNQGRVSRRPGTFDPAEGYVP